MTDPVADLLTRLRNGAHAQKEFVDIPGSGIKKEIARILSEQGYIEAWEVLPPGGGAPGETVRIRLKYTEDRKAVISGLRRASRPGRRSYVSHSDIPRVQGGMGTAIVSTSHGVMTGHEARREGVGGEVVAFVW